MPRYIVFDVETPNRKNDRMSAIGITVIDSTLEDKFGIPMDREIEEDLVSMCNLFL